MLEKLRILCIWVRTVQFAIDRVSRSRFDQSTIQVLSDEKRAITSNKTNHFGLCIGLDDEFSAEVIRRRVWLSTVKRFVGASQPKLE